MSTNCFHTGVPNCDLDYPIGHRGPISDSQSFNASSPLPVTFEVNEMGGSMKLKMTGKFIRGFLIREKNLSKGGSWSVTDDYDQWTLIKKDCVSHNRDFVLDREPEDMTAMEFIFESNLGETYPIFEAILVMKFDTWWHKIVIAKNPLNFLYEQNREYEN
ncbi:unnamed protein product [Lepeophtheirus salmonis]|uniref:(salmon louse) hypothetical protein n=1 Tax=Lepeophtheirus salmonis TaxID=72036 RepID=A0A7R8D002_LEPSM|nr:unnamed protein product [Lepeophtheirus salmonis]CAF2979679.1 unnamed protein product [Lepeophtheirus salmonis]